MSTDQLPWRWSAVPLRFFGLHGSIAGFFPLLVLTGLSRWTFYAMGVYGAYLIYCRHKKSTPGRMIQFLWAKHWERGQWSAF